jgi:hypothetical protein
MLDISTLIGAVEGPEELAVRAETAAGVSEGVT